MEGRNSVLELLESGKDINKIFIAKGERHGSINKIIAIAKEKGIIIVEKVRAEMKSEEQAKEFQVLQEENSRLRNEIKVLQEYKGKAHQELCRVRDEQKTIGKIKVNTEL